MKHPKGLICLGILSTLACLSPRIAAALETGDSLPDVEINDAEGGAHRLPDCTGKWILLDIWSSRNGQCLESIAAIQEAFSNNPSDNYTVIGVSIDPSLDDWKSAVEMMGMTYPQFHCPGNFTSAIADAFEITFLPSTWLIDPEGKVAIPQITAESIPGLFSLLAKGDKKAIQSFQSESAAWNEVIEAYRDEGMPGAEAGAVVNTLTAYLKDYPDGTYAVMAEGILLSKGLDSRGNAVTRAQVDLPAPDFAYFTTDGKERTLAELRGNWIAIVAWESWDVSFVTEELKALERKQKEFEAKGGALLFLNLDESEEDWKRTLEQHESDAIHARPAGRSPAYFRYVYDVEQPTTFLIDPEGVYLTRDFGAENVEHYLEVLTTGTERERTELYDSFIDPEEVKAAYAEVNQFFGQYQMEQIDRSVFIEAAEKFIEKYPYSKEARILHDVLE